MESGTVMTTGKASEAEEQHSRELGNRLYHEAQSRMRLLPNYYRWIIGRALPYIRGDVLELGVGAGIQVPFYRKKATSILGVDYNEELLSLFVEHHGGQNVAAQKCDLRGDWRELGDKRFDTILAMDVVEHFEDDAVFVEKAVRLLKPQGKFIMKVPAQSSLFSSVDEASGHYRRYDPDDIERLSKALNVVVVESSYMNPFGAWLYRRKKGAKTNFSKTIAPWKLRLGNLGIPFLRVLDSFQFLKGLSYVVVFERRE